MIDKKKYLKSYKKYHYSKTRKIVTFPLLIEDFEKISSQSKRLDIKTNTMAKKIVLNYLENKPNDFISAEEKELIQQYMRISRSIATNINQIAHNSNLRKYFDVNTIINSLKQYEDEFKSFITKKR
ncbi:MAG: Unknown protein [uncultured Campylobacterales bacterium]|uniref:Bacterial mobilisation domain-containing protein n=1 Tax=uncultured Campylobacterales bacterium TaxID=352960 RepID=A0A6S6SGN2_9BACT|nr:MAG: Unknown protein [uncultured Campylobacterales bacterium]